MANRFLKLTLTKKLKFMGEDLEIKKLNVAEVLEIQSTAKELEEAPNEENNIKVLALVIQKGAQELNDLSLEEIKGFPMDELSKLSNEIMKFSGIGADQGK